MKICHFSHIFQFSSGKKLGKGKRALKSHTISSMMVVKGGGTMAQTEDFISQLQAENRQLRQQLEESRIRAFNFSREAFFPI